MKKKYKLLLLLIPFPLMVSVNSCNVRNCYLSINSNAIFTMDSCSFIKNIIIVETNEKRKERTTVFDTTIVLPETKVSIPINMFIGKNIEIFVETNDSREQYLLMICSNCWNKKERFYFHRLYR